MKRDGFLTSKAKYRTVYVEPLSRHGEEPLSDYFIFLNDQEGIDVLYDENIKNTIKSTETFDFDHMSRLFMIDFIDYKGATLISENLNGISLYDTIKYTEDDRYNEEQNYNEIFFSAGHIDETEPGNITLQRIVTITILLIEVYKKRIRKNFPNRKVEILAVIEEEFGLSVNMRIHTIYDDSQITQMNTNQTSHDGFTSYQILEIVEPTAL